MHIYTHMLNTDFHSCKLTLLRSLSSLALDETQQPSQVAQMPPEWPCLAQAAIFKTLEENFVTIQGKADWLPWGKALCSQSSVWHGPTKTSSSVIKNSQPSSVGIGGTTHKENEWNLLYRCNLSLKPESFIIFPLFHQWRWSTFASLFKPRVFCLTVIKKEADTVWFTKQRVKPFVFICWRNVVRVQCDWAASPPSASRSETSSPVAADSSPSRLLPEQAIRPVLPFFKAMLSILGYIIIS